MKKAIIFDLDGTLINSLPDIAYSMNKALTAYDLPTFQVQEYQYKVGNGVFNIAKRSVLDHTECLEGVLKLYMEDYAKNCSVHSYAYDGIVDMLHALKAHNIKVCVFSNKDQADVENVLKHYFNDYPFAFIRGRRENVPLKPDKTGAELLLKDLNLSKDECFFCGDTMMDMCCGKDAGIDTIGVTWGFRPREELAQNDASFIVDTPEQLLQTILNS